MTDNIDQIELPAHPLSWRESLGRVLALSGPIIPAMLAQMLMNFFDTWMVSQIGVTHFDFLGWSMPLDTIAQPGANKVALAAVVPAAMSCWLIMSLFIGTSNVVSTFVSQSMGRGQSGEAGRYAWQSIHLAIVTIAVAAASVSVSRPMFAPFAPSGDVLDAELAYFNIRMFSLPIAVTVGGLSAFFTGIHRPARAAIIGIASNVLNLVLNWLLIYGHLGLPRMGIAGAALGSVLASLAGLVALAWFFFAPQFAREFGTRSGWRPSRSRLLGLIRIGSPSALSWVMDMIGWTLLTVVLVQSLGEAQAAASNIAMNYLQLGFMPVVGVGIALAALVGKAIGQRRPRDAHRFAASAFLVGGAYQFVIGVAMIAFREPLARFFTDDPQVADIASKLLVLAGAFQFFDAMGIVYTHALRGAGDTLFLLLAYAGLTFAFFVPAGLIGSWWLAPRLWPEAEPIAPWIAGTIYIVLLGLACWLRWRRGSWESIDIFGAGRSTAGSSSGQGHEGREGKPL